MSIKNFLLSITERPSFNLLAFQAFTFVILAIAGAIGAFQFAPFFGIKGVCRYYFYELLLIATITYLYTITTFIITSILNKLYIIFDKKLIAFNIVIFYILFGILTFLLQLQTQNTITQINFTQDMFGYCIILSFEIFIFTIFPYIVMFFIEQINNIRLEKLPYTKTPVRFYAVVIPTVIYICIIFYIIIEMFT